MRTGDIRAFNENLERHREFFITHSVYLLLQKLKLTAYRNLIHRVQAVLKDTKVPLENVRVALAWLGEAVDLDEIECVVATLIYQRQIKGYISHKLRTLVLSANNPFPKVER